MEEKGRPLPLRKLKSREASFRNTIISIIRIVRCRNINVKTGTKEGGLWAVALDYKSLLWRVHCIGGESLVPPAHPPSDTFITFPKPKKGGEKVTSKADGRRSSSFHRICTLSGAAPTDFNRIRGASRESRPRLSSRDIYPLSILTSLPK